MERFPKGTSFPGFQTPSLLPAASHIFLVGIRENPNSSQAMAGAFFFTGAVFRLVKDIFGLRIGFFADFILFSPWFSLSSTLSLTLNKSGIIYLIIA
jgi:hypothetical protein